MSCNNSATEVNSIIFISIKEASSMVAKAGTKNEIIS